jgi:LysR family cyn operon transcriptional activator
MNLRALRTFITTVEAGGLGRACARLHLSQPAASRQIRSLEVELGVALFQRVGRRLQLTSDGEDLLQQSRRLLDDAALLMDQARALKGGQTGTLRIAATPHVIAGVLAPFLRRYGTRHRGVEVQLLEGGAALQPTRLERGEVHLAIMPSGDQRFYGRLLYPVYALAVSRRDPQLSRHRVLEVSSLADKPIMLLRREFGSREWFDAACAIAHFRPRVRLESAAPQTLIDLAEAGYGVAIVPSTVSIRNRNVSVLPVVQRKVPLGRWSMIAWNPQRLLPLYAVRFADELLAFVRRHTPGREHVRRAPLLARPIEPTG